MTLSLRVQGRQLSGSMQVVVPELGENDTSSISGSVNGRSGSFAGSEIDGRMRMTLSADGRSITVNADGESMVFRRVP